MYIDCSLPDFLGGCVNELKRLFRVRLCVVLCCLSLQQVQCMHLAEQGQTLLVAGAESTLTSLTRSQLERKARTPVTPRSVYALSVNGTGAHEGVRTFHLQHHSLAFVVVPLSPPRTVISGRGGVARLGDARCLGT